MFSRNTEVYNNKIMCLENAFCCWKVVIIAKNWWSWHWSCIVIETWLCALAYVHFLSPSSLTHSQPSPKCILFGENFFNNHNIGPCSPCLQHFCNIVTNSSDERIRQKYFFVATYSLSSYSTFVIFGEKKVSSRRQGCRDFLPKHTNTGKILIQSDAKIYKMGQKCYYWP
jgi:hypothetical protein